MSHEAIYSILFVLLLVYSCDDGVLNTDARSILLQEVFQWIAGTVLSGSAGLNRALGFPIYTTTEVGRFRLK